MVRVYLPPDAATSVSVMAHCLRSKGYVNLVSSRWIRLIAARVLTVPLGNPWIIESKADTVSYLSVEETDRHCVAGKSAVECDFFTCYQC